MHIHDHGHGSHAGHDHAAHDHSAQTTRAFVVGVALNGAIVVAQVIVGLAAHSMALLADAGHNLGDVLGLALGLVAARLARRRPTSRHTYGFRRATILSALANAVLLLVATGALAWESIGRLSEPQPIHAGAVVVVASIAVAGNGLSAMLFFRDRKRDLNVRAAFVHLAGDAATSLGVVIAAALIAKTGWTIIDPLAGLAVSITILVGTWSLLRRSFAMSLDAVPADIDLEKVRAYLADLPGICEVHDLHVWGLSTTETALTVHLVLAEGAALRPGFFGEVSRAVHERFGIGHATLQVEHAVAGEPCSLARDDVI